MASTYPTALDAFTNPTSTSLLTSPSHAQQHSDINDAMEAVQTKLAIGNTVIGTYTAYTPTINQLTIGNGTVTSAYCQVNKLVHYYGKIVFGSTTTFGVGNVSFNLPINPDLVSSSPFTYSAIGTTSHADASANTAYNGIGMVNASGTACFTSIQNTAGTYSQFTNITSTIPFTWASGDYITWNLMYRVA